MTMGVSDGLPLENRFRAYARLTAQDAGMTFSQQSLDNLDRVIRDGVETLTRDTTPSDEQLWRAEQQLRVLVLSMAREAQAQGALTLHEWSLDRARRLLCPLPPWFPEPCT